MDTDTCCQSHFGKGVRLMSGFMHRFKSHLIELDGHFVIVELKFTWPRKKITPPKN